jgi:hypothetical protein
MFRGCDASIARAYRRHVSIWAQCAWHTQIQRILDERAATSKAELFRNAELFQLLRDVRTHLERCKRSGQTDDMLNGTIVAA